MGAEGEHITTQNPPHPPPPHPHSTLAHLVEVTDLVERERDAVPLLECEQAVHWVAHDLVAERHELVMRGRVGTDFGQRHHVVLRHQRHTIVVAPAQEVAGELIDVRTLGVGLLG